MYFTVSFTLKENLFYKSIKFEKSKLNIGSIEKRNEKRKKFSLFSSCGFVFYLSVVQHSILLITDLKTKLYVLFSFC